MRRHSMISSSVLAASIGLYATEFGASDAPRIAKDELKSMLDDPGVVVIDVRAYTDWILSAEKIRGAVREDYRDFDDWSAKYPKDKTVVSLLRVKERGHERQSGAQADRSRLPAGVRAERGLGRVARRRLPGRAQVNR